MDLLAALKRRRMVRSFSGRPVDPDAFESVLAAALRAPSAGNTAGWSSVVLRGPAQTRAFWEATTTPTWRERSRRWPGLSRAPAIVAMFVDPTAYTARYSETDKAGSGLEEEVAWTVPYWFVDGGMAVSYMLLAAADAGLGACFLGNFRGETALADELGIPHGRRYLGAVLVGEPASDDPPSASLDRGRRTLDDAFHEGRWRSEDHG